MNAPGAETNSRKPLPIELFAADGGLHGMSFSNAAEAATGYERAVWLSGFSLDEEDLLHPSSIENPVARRLAMRLLDPDGYPEADSRAAEKIAEEGDIDPDQTIRRQVELLLEQYRDKAILDLYLGKAPVRIDPLELLNRDRTQDIPWMLSTDEERIRVSNGTPGRILVGDDAGQRTAPEIVDPLHPKYYHQKDPRIPVAECPDYKGLRDLREVVIDHPEVVNWITRRDHPYPRWNMLQSWVRWGTSLALFQFVDADPYRVTANNDAETREKEVHPIQRARLEAVHLALEEMSSKAGHNRVHDFPLDAEIDRAVAETVGMLHRDKALTPKTVSPEVLSEWRKKQISELITGDRITPDNESRTKPINRLDSPEDRELQSLSRRILSVTGEYPKLRPALFRAEILIAKETGGPNCRETLKRGPDVFEAALLGFLPTIRILASYLKHASAAQEAATIDWSAWEKEAKAA